MLFFCIIFKNSYFPLCLQPVSPNTEVVFFSHLNLVFHFPTFERCVYWSACIRSSGSLMEAGWVGKCSRERAPTSASECSSAASKFSTFLFWKWRMQFPFFFPALLYCSWKLNCCNVKLQNCCELQNVFRLVISSPAIFLISEKVTYTISSFTLLVLP